MKFIEKISDNHGSCVLQSKIALPVANKIIINNFILFTFILFFSCASISFDARPSSKSMRVDNMFQELSKVSDRDVDGLKIYKHRLPIGFEYVNGQLDYDQTNYEMIGQIQTEMRYGFFDRAGFTFYPYGHDQTFRKVLCYPQTPLIWLSLGIWNIVPLHYPCMPFENMDDDLDVNFPHKSREEAHMLLLKKLAIAANATHIVFIKWDSKQYKSSLVYILRKTSD